jgi:imidazole glycerol phosphate synthase glutamine amidotransferase subunit
LTSPRVTVLDYGMGNIRSIAHALERAGATVMIDHTPQALESADRLVIPGQGAFGQVMDRLTGLSLVEPIQAWLRNDRPYLGVCLGLQVLFAKSEEAPESPGLGIVNTAVSALPVGPKLKRPHMGWAPVEYSGQHPVLRANPSGEAFYFVHSFAAREAEGWSTAATVHGHPFVAAMAKGRLVATQFHPEKSQDAGEKLLRAWLAL